MRRVVALGALVGSSGAAVTPCPSSVRMGDASVSCDAHCTQDSVGGHAFQAGQMHGQGSETCGDTYCTCRCRYTAAPGAACAAKKDAHQASTAVGSTCYYDVCSVTQPAALGKSGPSVQCPSAVRDGDQLSCHSHCTGISVDGKSFSEGELGGRGSAICGDGACTCRCRYSYCTWRREFDNGDRCYNEVCSLLTTTTTTTLATTTQALPQCSYEVLQGFCLPNDFESTLCSDQSSAARSRRAETCSAEFAGKGLPLVGDWSKETGFAYFHPRSCDHECAQKRCSNDPACHGFSRYDGQIDIGGQTYTEVVSLKNSISGSEPWVDYSCLKKVTLACAAPLSGGLRRCRPGLLLAVAWSLLAALPHR